MREWRKNNLEKARAIGRRHREKFPNEQREWYRNNRELAISLTKAWRKKNKEKVVLDAKRWAKENPEKYAESKARTIAKNPEKYRRLHAARQSRYRSNHPDRKARIDRARYARVRMAPGEYSESKWLQRVEYHGWKCFYCKVKLNKNTLTQDHAIPLIRGGSNHAANLLPACRSCNSKKKDLTVFEYLRRLAA